MNRTRVRLDIYFFGFPIVSSPWLSRAEQSSLSQIGHCLIQVVVQIIIYLTPSPKHYSQILSILSYIYVSLECLEISCDASGLVQWLKSICCYCRRPRSAHMWQLIRICNSSFRTFNDTFWPMTATDKHMVHIQANTDTHEIKVNTSPKEEIHCNFPLVFLYIKLWSFI